MSGGVYSLFTRRRVNRLYSSGQAASMEALLRATVSR